MGEEINLKKIDWEKVNKIFAPEKKAILEILEEESNRYPHVKEILLLLAAGSVLSLSVLFPTFPMILTPFLSWSKYNKGRFKQTVNRLKAKKLVEIIEENGEQVVKITEKGRIKALKYKIEEIKIKEPKRWDKCWRIVIFDVPEGSKKLRDLFREKLKSLHFYPLQKSVWVHPFPCFDEIEFLRQIYGVGFDVSYVIAKKIEEEKKLLSFFNL